MNKRDEVAQNKGSQAKGEYRIDEMFGEIYETETMNMDDGSDLLQDGLTEEEKARIFKLTMGKIGESPAPVYRTKGKKRRILLVALIAVCVFATTAFAAEIFQWDARLSNYFAIGEHDSAGLSGGGMNVGVSDENGGVTIEAVQTIGDGNNMYILLDVTAPEGQTLYPESGFDMIYLRVGGPTDGPTGMGYSCNMLEDDNPQDSKATFLFAMEADKKINDKKINIKFENLRHYIIGSGEMAVDTQGEWILEWKLAYEDISQKYDIGKELTVEGGTVNVDSVAISPIAVNVQISGSYIKEYDSAPREPGESELVRITEIRLKDGTLLTPEEDAASGGTSIRGSNCVMNIQMKKLLDVSQVSSITINGTEYVLN